METPTVETPTAENPAVKTPAVHGAAMDPGGVKDESTSIDGGPAPKGPVAPETVPVMQGDLPAVQTVAAGAAGFGAVLSPVIGTGSESPSVVTPAAETLVREAIDEEPEPPQPTVTTLSPTASTLRAADPGRTDKTERPSGKAPETSPALEAPHAAAGWTIAAPVAPPPLPPVTADRPPAAVPDRGAATTAPIAASSAATAPIHSGGLPSFAGPQPETADTHRSAPGPVAFAITLRAETTSSSPTEETPFQVPQELTGESATPAAPEPHAGGGGGAPATSSEAIDAAGAERSAGGDRSFDQDGSSDPERSAEPRGRIEAPEATGPHPAARPAGDQPAQRAVAAPSATFAQPAPPPPDGRAGLPGPIEPGLPWARMAAAAEPDTGLTPAPGDAGRVTLEVPAATRASAARADGGVAADSRVAIEWSGGAPGGGLRLGVRTADPLLRDALRDGLPGLVDRLRADGFQAKAADTRLAAVETAETGGGAAGDGGADTHGRRQALWEQAREQRPPRRSGAGAAEDWAATLRGRRQEGRNGR